MPESIEPIYNYIEKRADEEAPHIAGHVPKLIHEYCPNLLKDIINLANQHRSEVAFILLTALGIGIYYFLEYLKIRRRQSRESSSNNKEQI